MSSKTSFLTSDLTSMYARGYGAPSRFTNTRVPRPCGQGGSGRQCGGEAPGDRQEGALAGPMSEEIAVGRSNPGAAAAAPTSCCALTVRGSNTRTSTAIAAAIVLSTGLAACGSGGDAGIGAPTTRAAVLTTTATTTPPVASDPAVLRRARRACRSTPARVVKTYLPAARKRGADKALLRMAADPPRRVTRGPGYALLAGAVYASSLPVRQRVGVAPACAKELMRGKHVPAAGKRKSMSNEGTSR
jgi:hypothetical protein